MSVRILRARPVSVIFQHVHMTGQRVTKTRSQSGPFDWPHFQEPGESSCTSRRGPVRRRSRDRGRPLCRSRDDRSSHLPFQAHLGPSPCSSAIRRTSPTGGSNVTTYILRPMTYPLASREIANRPAHQTLRSRLRRRRVKTVQPLGVDIHPGGRLLPLTPDRSLTNRRTGRTDDVMSSGSRDGGVRSLPAVC